MSIAETSLNWIEADYLLETYAEIEKTAAVMAGEQSSGTFIAVPGETESLKKQYAASGFANNGMAA